MISLMKTFRLTSDVVGLVGRDWSVRRLHRRDFLFHRSCFTSTTTCKIRYFAQTTFIRYQETISTLNSPSLSSLLQLSLHPATSKLLPSMSQSPAERAIEEDDKTEAPLTMAASVVLTNLPRDASKALETAGNLGIEKSIYHDTLMPRTSSHFAPG
jgi:hypothetical protein